VGISVIPSAQTAEQDQQNYNDQDCAHDSSFRDMTIK
jgi:hypothetical protein